MEWATVTLPGAEARSVWPNAQPLCPCPIVCIGYGNLFEVLANWRRVRGLTILRSSIFSRQDPKMVQKHKIRRVNTPVRSLWLESEAGRWDLVSARSLRCTGPFDVTVEEVVRDSLPLCPATPLVDALCWSDGSSEFRATSKLPPECWRAVVACWMVKPISTIVAMCLSDNCCNTLKQLVSRTTNIINDHKELHSH